MCCCQATYERIVTHPASLEHPPKKSHYCGTLLLPWAFSTRGTGGRAAPSFKKKKKKKLKGAAKRTSPAVYTSISCLMLINPPYGPLITFLPLFHPPKISTWPLVFSHVQRRASVDKIRQTGGRSASCWLLWANRGSSGLLESPHTASPLYARTHTHSHLLSCLKDYKGEQRAYLKERCAEKKNETLCLMH